MSAPHPSHVDFAAAGPVRALALLGLSAAIGGWTACSDSGAVTEADVARTDSAGVTIVTSPDRVNAVWRLEAAPRLAIGRLDGPEEHQLFRVAGARLLSDGRLAIANAGSHEVRLYGPDGEHLRSIGGEGEGPGEFSNIGRLDVSGEDSLYVWDGRQFRMSVFDPAGDFVRNYKLDTPWEGAFPRYTGRFADGTGMAAVGQVFSRSPETGEVLRRENPALRYDAEGHVVDTITTLTTRGSLIQSLPDGGGFFVYSIPFDPGTSWAIDGRGLHRAHGPRFEVRTLDETGVLVRIARVARTPIAVDAELRDAAIEAALARYPEGRVALAREAFGMMPFPDSVAAYDELLGGDSGRLWARRHPLPDQEEAVWDVFDASGALEAAVTIPVAATVYQAGRDFVLLRERDELDVERVTLYGLEAAEGTG